MPGASPSLKQALQDTLQAAGNDPVYAMNWAFQHVQNVSGPQFRHDLSGVVQTIGGSVEIHVRQIGEEPDAYSVVFRRMADPVVEWNAVHPVGSRFLCEQYPDVVLTSQAPAFFVEGRGTAVECKIPGHAVGGGILIDDLVCVDGLKSPSARIPV